MDVCGKEADMAVVAFLCGVVVGGFGGAWLYSSWAHRERGGFWDVEDGVLG